MKLCFCETYFSIAYQGITFHKLLFICNDMVFQDTVLQKSLDFSQQVHTYMKNSESKISDDADYGILSTWNNTATISYAGIWPHQPAAALAHAKQLVT